MVDAAVSKYGRLDVAFNNAGIIHDTKPLAEIDTATWDRVIAVNLSGVYYLMKYEIPAMRTTAKGGSIINTASIAGLSATYNLTAYTASKHGVIGLTRGAAEDHAKDNVRINALCPGSVATNIAAGAKFDPAAFAEMGGNLMHRAGLPEEMVSAVMMLASPYSSFTSGAEVVVDGCQVHKF